MIPETERLSGILLHPTSLPGSPGTGTLGRGAYAFVDWLKNAGQKLWQILPLGPTGYGDSPYASFSTFAGNPLLIDLDELVHNGFLNAAQAVPPEYITSNGPIDFGSLVYWKLPLLKTAAKQFLTKITADAAQKKAYETFKSANGYWLNDYALFMSIKEYYDEQAQKEKKTGAMWSNYWPRELALRNQTAVQNWATTHETEIAVHKVVQFFFMQQWFKLKKYANDAGIFIFGDIPIFVASDSADVWANQSLFQLDANGRPLAVAGVPPDYFSETGQLWGNPLYDWESMKTDGYNWWIKRIQSALSLVDLVRIDHFRGFEAYWAIPANEKTAVNGTWVPGPGHDFFATIQKKLGTLPLVAEDLGVITEGVRELRDTYGFPGMKILQFAFDVNEAGGSGCINPFLPHMYGQNCVVYTGTHDNNTMKGWLDAATKEELALVRNYLNASKNADLCSLLVRLALSSVARMAVVPLQDLYNIGTEGRINFPSKTGGTNWQWRMGTEHLSAAKAVELKQLCALYGRNVKPREDDTKTDGR